MWDFFLLTNVTMHTLWRSTFLFVSRGSNPRSAPQVKCIRMAAPLLCPYLLCIVVKSNYNIFNFKIFELWRKQKSVHIVAKKSRQ